MKNICETIFAVVVFGAAMQCGAGEFEAMSALQKRLVAAGNGMVFGCEQTAATPYVPICVQLAARTVGTENNPLRWPRRDAYTRAVGDD